MDLREKIALALEAITNDLPKENAQLKAELEQARQREARLREALQELRDLRYSWR